MLACRRTTFEWVLRRDRARPPPHVSLLDGVVVDGPARCRDGAGRPACTRRVDGRPTTFDADLVVAAQRPPRRRAGLARRRRRAMSTRRSRTPGIVYLSRFYRLHDGADVPPDSRPDRRRPRLPEVRDVPRRQPHVLGHVRDASRRRRAAGAMLLDPATFERAGLARCRRPPVGRTGRAPSRSPPVHVMAKLLNRLRRFTDERGHPLARGFVAVGDAHTCTNPLYGRGCSLAMVQATLLADAVARRWRRPRTRSPRTTSAASSEEVEPWYHAAVMADRDNQRRADAAGENIDESDSPRVHAAR